MAQGNFMSAQERPRVRAPEITGGQGWLNTDKPLSLAALKGKIILLDFWTYGCINCIHIIPDLKKLEAKYANQLVVIGVHSAKFQNEKETENIRRIILRYEIERALIEGVIEAEDIPALWDEKMQTLLGLDTRGNYRDGCMQDVHWTEGAFGYFPSYTLGAMYAAQWFAAMRRETPDLDARIAAGDLTAVFDWLGRNIWSQASRWETPELVRRASGEPLNPAYLRAHLEKRYLNDA